MKLLFLTHHKCGSGWFNKINFELLKLYGRVVYVLNDNDQNYQSVNEFYEKRNAGFVAFNNADIDYLNVSDEFKAVHVVRDPRDIIVSAYFSHKKVHPLLDNEEGKAMAEHRLKLNNLPLEEGLLEEIAFSKKWYLDKMNKLARFQSEKIFRLKLEDISSNYIEMYRQILAFYGLRIVDDTFWNNLTNHYYNYTVPLVKRNIVQKVSSRSEISYQSFERLMSGKSWEKLAGGRSKGDVNINSHYRKGVAGDWKNYFTKNIEIGFYQNFGDLLKVLDYE